MKTALAILSGVLTLAVVTIVGLMVALRRARAALAGARQDLEQSRSEMTLARAELVEARTAYAALAKAYDNQAAQIVRLSEDLEVVHRTLRASEVVRAQQAAEHAEEMRAMNRRYDVQERQTALRAELEHLQEVLR